MFSFTREEIFGLSVTLATHIVMLLLAFFMVTSASTRDYVSLIEVTLGEFYEGAPDEMPGDDATPPQTTPVPSEETAPDPATTEPQPIPQQPQEAEDEPARDADLPDQEEPVQEEEVVTPDTEEIDPTSLPVPPPDPSETIPAEEDATEDDETIEGEEGTIRGQPDSEEGTSADQIRMAPFQLEWEGDINRAPVVQPLPNYVSQTEAVISVRFEVRPDGTVGRLQPIIKADPELENEVMRTLRTWRFSRLPSNLPQESQYGTITFRFVLE
ncbi:energy transducer TonB [Balneolaceae bacterium ANBcel3]|nr:energy transducer TonB [Balneolaceae bacterium ANBcel3]